MATYANRTCNKCGIRKPQPQMYQREVYVETGKSKTGVSGATWIGVLSGDKKSGSQVRNWMFNNGQRTYKRKKQVWMCGACAGVERAPKKVDVEVSAGDADSTTKKGMSTAAKWFWGLTIVVIIAGAIDDNKKSTTKPQSAVATQTPP